MLRKFEHHRMSSGWVGGRVVKGLGKQSAGEGEGEDVEMADADEKEGGEKRDPSEEDDEEKSRDEKVVSTTITRMAVSPDGQWLATSDDRHRTHIFNLDSIQHHCVLPSFPHPIYALAFLPSSSSTLILGLANNTIQIYDVELRMFPNWSRHLSTALPRRFKHLHDPIVGVAFNFEKGEAEERSAVFWGSTWICKIQLDAGVVYAGFEKKRRRDKSGKKIKDVAPPHPPPAQDGGDEQHLQQSTSNFKVITMYRPILFVDFLAPGEMVVVERPLVDVLAKLPPAYFKPKYGAS